MRSTLIVAAAVLPICAAGQHVYRIGDPGVVAPELTREVKAGYTPGAFQGGIEGSVVLEAVVLETGSVGEVRVRQRLDDDLDIQAVDAVKQWTFRPGTKDGQAVPVEVTVEINFTRR
jgi:protein TonB